MKNPNEGGCYIRGKDGTLRRAGATDATGDGKPAGKAPAAKGSEKNTATVKDKSDA